jgi:hypothetical protein
LASLYKKSIIVVFILQLRHEIDCTHKSSSKKKKEQPVGDVLLYKERELHGKKSHRG